MNFSKHIYQIFLLSILVPGLILAYLSFRTVKDERILIEKSLENRNGEFVDAIQGVLEKTKAEHLARLQEQLQRSSSSSAPDNYLLLATDLLENPLVQSLAIFRREEMVFPRRLAYGDTFSLPVASDPADPAANPFTAGVSPDTYGGSVGRSRFANPGPAAPGRGSHRFHPEWNFAPAAICIPCG